MTRALHQADRLPPEGAPRWRRFLAYWSLPVFAAWIALPFTLAGSLAWNAGWLHFGCVVTAVLAHGRYVTRTNPGLKARRRRIGEGTQGWDVVWNALFWPFMASIAVVGGHQYGATGSSLPTWTWPAGIALLAAGIALSAWAMSVNPHFESTVRIQSDVGHQVCEDGPYRHLRHPGYLGLVLWALATPLLVLSTWAIYAAAATTAWIALRAGLEDAFLRRELPGYAEYAARTRYRLVPGVW